MPNESVFDPRSADTWALRGPIRLHKQMTELPGAPGLYIITCGDCLAHVGTSGSMRTRVQELAKLGVHHGAIDVLCVAYCTGHWPLVRWEPLPVKAALRREAELKERYAPPPVPASRYQDCRRGKYLRDKLLRVAGPATWEAGYIEAVFAIGNTFRLLLDHRFECIWRTVGKPPGPWWEE